MQSYLGDRLPVTQNNNSYYKAASPGEFTRLLGIGDEKFCRFAWSKQIKSKKRSAWQAIGQRRSGKPVTSLLNFKMQATGYLETKCETYCSVDVFLSPNQFFEWRNTKQLAQLHANWLEIDTVGHDVLSLDDQQEIFDDIQRIITEKNLPAPTGFVMSGSGGIHVYWIYQGIEAYKWRIRIWREITLILARTVKKARPAAAKWVVDFAASRDPARVLRLPGTYHGKSGRLVHPYIGGPIYQFNELAQLLVQSKENIAALHGHKDQPARVVRIKPKPPVYQPMSDHTVTGKHTIGQWWFRIYSEICTHARLHRVKEGKRDLYAFMLFVALRHIKQSKEGAYKAIEALNDEFIGLDKEELQMYLKTAMTTHYRYTKDSLADYLENNLGISSDFLYQTQSRPLNPSEVKAKQQEAAKTTHSTRRSNTLMALKAALMTLVETRMNVTQEAIARLSGRSLRTVKRYWKQLNINKVTNAPLLYIPDPEVVACG